jgi:hypothetical protein
MQMIEAKRKKYPPERRVIFEAVRAVFCLSGQLNPEQGFL